MRALVQRVAEASVTVDGTQVGRTGEGLVVLLGVSKDDGEADARYLVDKVATLRVFADESGRFNRSALDTGSELLVIPQFTLYADTRRGRRPDFTQAAAPEEAEGLYQRAVEMFRELGLKVETGRFREHMLVEIKNDGPVTILIDSADRSRPRRG